MDSFNREGEAPAEPNALMAQQEPRPPDSTYMHLQFSLRWMLALITVASVCLAIGVYFAGVMLAFVTFGLVQVATLLAADWLIRPENRRWLAFVTAGSWTVLGSGLLMVVATDVRPWVAVICILMGGFCFVLAAKRWKQLAAKKFT